MSKAPTTCHYCDGEGNSSAGGKCGFCEKGRPLDTQEDWDRSWVRVFTPTTRQQIPCSHVGQDLTDCHNGG